MEKRFKLKVEDVLNKQFNIDFKGYSSVEVDEFLDLVINDYQEYDAMIENLGERLQEYEKQIAAMKAFKSATETSFSGNRKDGTGKPRKRETQIW